MTTTPPDTTTAPTAAPRSAPASVRTPEPIADAPVLRAGKPPVGTGSSPLFAQLIALAFVGLAVVAVQHLLVSLGAITGTSWLSSTVDAADGIKGDSPLVLVVGIVAVVLGVLLLPVVLKPRPRKGVAVTAETGVHLRPRDLRKIAQSAIDGTDTVTDVQVKATRRRLKVTASTVAAKERNGAVAADVRERLEPTLAALERRPKVSVSVRNESI